MNSATMNMPNVDLETVPAIRGKMGTTDYFQAVMSAQALAAVARPAQDFELFEDFEPDAKMQRELSEQRVESQIVPYLINSADRFFGSIIVLVYEPDVFEFTPFSTHRGYSELSAAYRSAAEMLGTLTISSGTGTLFALDGQHRLHALRVVTQGGAATPLLNIPLDGEYTNDIANDQLSVIFLKYQSIRHARRIFNKVNRHAKPTSRQTNILTSEDDGEMIVTRCLCGFGDPSDFDSDIAGPIPRKLENGHPAVRTDGNTLPQSRKEIFALDTVYSSVASIVKAVNHPPINEQATIVRPPDSLLLEAYEACAMWWGALLSEFEPIARAISLPNRINDWRHDNHHGYSLALRPNSLKVIFEAIGKAHSRFGLTPLEACKRLSKLNWAMDDPIWRGVLVTGNERLSPKTKQLEFAADFVCYLLVGAECYDVDELESLWNLYRDEQSEYGYRPRKLPRSVTQ